MRRGLHKVKKGFVLQKDGIYRFGWHYLIYSFNRKKSDKLYVVFSGVTSEPGYNKMHYYDFRNKLDGNVLHIMDHHGTHGSYLLSMGGNYDIRDGVCSLIQDVMGILEIDQKDLFLMGTSKGGTSAVAYGLLLGYGNVIAGEPPIKVGDFHFRTMEAGAESGRSIIYSMTGSVSSEAVEQMNKMLEDIFKERGQYFKGHMEILTGTVTGGFDRHVKYALDYANEYGIRNDKISVKMLNIKKHNDIATPFVKWVTESSALEEFDCKDYFV